MNLLLLLVLLAAGCGGEAADDEKPALTPAVASRLASASDAIAESLESGDVCTAAGRADDLLGAVKDAIQKGEIPPAFQEELTGRANELVNEVNCPPPPPPPEEEPEEDNKDKDKKKGKGNEGPPPPPAETTPTDTDNSGPG